MLVLYAEDDIDDFYFFVEVLDCIEPGANCINVVNGAQALTFLDECVNLPDYIFLDVDMPTMDGKACLKSIRRDARFKSIPIIIYTTSQNPLDQEFCKELGVAAYLSKPNSISDGKVALKQIMNL